MKIQTKAVHAGDRKKTGAPRPGHHADLHRARAYFYDDMEQLDRVFAQRGSRATATRATTIPPTRRWKNW